MTPTQKRVHDVIEAHREGATLYDLVAILGWPVNRISGRITELRKGGSIYRNGSRVSLDSGVQNSVWSINHAVACV